MWGSGGFFCLCRSSVDIGGSDLEEVASASRCPANVLRVGQSPSIPTANHPRDHAASRTGRASHARAAKTLTHSAVLSTRSTTNPGGATSRPHPSVPIATAPSMNMVRRQIRPENGRGASRLIQSPFWKPIGGPDCRPIDIRSNRVNTSLRLEHESPSRSKAHLDQLPSRRI